MSATQTTLKGKTMKKVSTAQMNWMFNKGFAWEGEEGVFYTSKNVYHWVVPFINRDGDVDGGYYEAE